MADANSIQTEQPAWLRCEFCHQLGVKNPLATHDRPVSGTHELTGDLAIVNIAKLRAMPVGTAEEGARAGTAHGYLEVLCRMGLIELPAAGVRGSDHG